MPSGVEGNQDTQRPVTNTHRPTEESLNEAINGRGSILDRMKSAGVLKVNGDSVQIDNTVKVIPSIPNPQQPPVQQQIVAPAEVQPASKDIVLPEPVLFEEEGGDPNAAVHPDGDTLIDKETPAEVPQEPEEASSVPAAENFKRLRASIKEKDEAIKAEKKRAEDLAKKVKDYETAAVVPEVVQKYENRIKELTPFENIYNLENSEGYKETYVKPILEKRGKLNELIKEYGLPETVTDQLIAVKSKAELNRYLSENVDSVGAGQISDLVYGIKEIQGKITDAKKEPARELAKLDERHKALTAQQTVERKQSIARVAKDSWQEALVEIQREGQFQALILKDGDEARNQIVLKHITNASTEFGKMITQLAEEGIKTLPKNFAKAMAKTIAIAQASALNGAAVNGLMEELNAVQQNVKRTTSYERPSIGGPGKGSQSAAPAAPRDINAAAQANIEKVLGRR